MSARHVRVAEETRKRKASALLVQPDAAIKSAVEIVLLCEQCNERPRAGRGGALRRCIECIRQAAEVDRLAREEAQRRHVTKLFELKSDVASKTCKSCHSVKPLAQFSKHRLSRDGHVHTCKGCTANSRQKRAELSVHQVQADKARRAKPHRKEANLAAVVRWQAVHPEAGHARRALKQAVKNGAVIPAPCCEAVGCDEKRVQGHHSSYRQARRATWLCAKHHRRAHAEHRVRLKRGGRVRLPQENGHG